MSDSNSELLVKSSTEVSTEIQQQDFEIMNLKEIGL